MSQTPAPDQEPETPDHSVLSQILPSGPDRSPRQLLSPDLPWENISMDYFWLTTSSGLFAGVLLTDNFTQRIIIATTDTATARLDQWFAPDAFAGFRRPIRVLSDRGLVPASVPRSLSLGHPPHNPEPETSVPRALTPGRPSRPNGRFCNNPGPTSTGRVLHPA